MKRAHFGRVGSSSLAKNTDAALRISLALRSSRTSRSSSFEPLALGAGQAIAARAGVGLGLAHPVPQRLAVDAEVLGDMRDRAAGIKDEPDRALTQLVAGISSGRASTELASSPQDRNPGFEDSVKPDTRSSGPG